jgi:guanylate kinase
LKPLLIVISAPSGTGKTTLCDRLLQDYPELTYSISCTTREPRGAEVDGEDYYFLDAADFARRLAAGAFLEHARVHGFDYGTLKEPVYSSFAEGLSMLMDIDVAGAAQVRAYVSTLPPADPLRAGFVDIFIRPPSLEALRARLEGRGEDDEATIERRLRNAGEELARAGEYRYHVVNDDLEIAYRELCGIIETCSGLRG